MIMKSAFCLYCFCAEQCVYIFDDKEPCPLIELAREEEEERISKDQHQKKDKVE